MANKLSRTEKIEKINTIKKEEELHELLMDLLPKMGYSDVTLTHERGNLPENGKDVVASLSDIIENKKEWTAFVVKKGDIRGTSQGVQEVKAQIQDCFDYSWNSIQRGKGIKINKVKVVTSGKYNSGAIQKILDDHFLGNPNISFWSATELVEHIDRYHDIVWIHGNKIYKNYIQIFQSKNMDDEITKTIGLKNEKIKKLLILPLNRNF